MPPAGSSSTGRSGTTASTGSASGCKRTNRSTVTDGRSDEAIGNGIKLTRVFDAPRERVWREWTEPEAFADWFGAPSGEVPLESVSMDVRAGGAFRLTMYAGPARQEIQWRGEYLEVVEPERLVFGISDQPSGD